MSFKKCLNYVRAMAFEFSIALIGTLVMSPPPAGAAGVPDDPSAAPISEEGIPVGSRAQLLGDGWGGSEDTVSVASRRLDN